ncbi:MAG: SDR family NAD(P)-dependent oxidoreductase [Planctomycetota bacterium]|nr:SDR family NAD(P)-dependent oxidoreductase [Planctomycetota bacterium]
MMPDQTFDGKTALVTGASRGIGKACALLLARAGAKVAVNYHQNKTAADETVNAIQAMGAEAAAIQADIACPEGVEALVRTTTETLGPVDLLVNNAGIFDRVGHEQTDWELWRKTMAVNLDSAFLVTWAVKQGMIDRKYGRIVNISSIAGVRPRPMAIAYAASKAGMIGFARSLAQALAPHNIRVNSVAPGLIETEILDGVAQDDLQALIDATPIPRIGRVDEIAELVFFLLSEKSSFITGQTIVASGGRVTLP